MSILSNKKGLAGLAGLLITLGVVCLLVYLAATLYMKNPATGPAARASMAEQGIPAAGTGTFVEDVQQRVDAASKLMEKKAADMEAQYK